MVIIEEIDRNKPGHPEPSDSGNGMDKVLPQKIIDFDSGSQNAGEDLVREREECSQAHGASSFTVRLPDDRTEFLLTIAISFALLLGFYVGLIGF